MSREYETGFASFWPKVPEPKFPGEIELPPKRSANVVFETADGLYAEAMVPEDTLRSAEIHRAAVKRPSFTPEPTDAIGFVRRRYVRTRDIHLGLPVYREEL